MTCRQRPRPRAVAATLAIMPSRWRHIAARWLGRNRATPLQSRRNSAAAGVIAVRSSRQRLKLVSSTHGTRCICYRTFCARSLRPTRGMTAPAKREPYWRTDISGETRLRLAKFTYTWTIHDFSLRREVTGNKIDSPLFSTAGTGKNTWILQLYPNGVDQGSKDFVSVYVQDVGSSSCIQYFMEYKFAVIDDGGQKANVQEGTSNFTRSGSWGFAKFIERGWLLKGTDRLLPNDKLTIYCEMLGFEGSQNISSPSTSVAVNVPDCDLSQDFGHLLASRHFSDVILSVEEEEIHAHKVVLAARSPVFAAMFKHEMKEKEQSRVEITDCDVEVLHQVVEFIYTGRAPKLNEMAEQVLVVANKYDLGRLRAMCEDIACSKLLLRTAAQILTLADMHNADQLKANAIKFIKAHAAGVMETDGWKVMEAEKPHLAVEALCSLVV